MHKCSTNNVIMVTAESHKTQGGKSGEVVAPFSQMGKSRLKRRGD